VTTGPVELSCTEEKTHLRSTLIAQLSSLDRAERAKGSTRIAESLMGLAEIRACKSLMLFLSMDDELDTDGLVDRALAAGIAVYAPVTHRRSRRLVPTRVSGLDAVVVGAYGIREPRSDDVLEPELLEGVIVPAVAFDAAGARLGRGGGFYDRMLERMPEGAIRCGVAFDFQIVDAVPCEPHDLPVDLVVTESRVIRCNR